MNQSSQIFNQNHWLSVSDLTAMTWEECTSSLDLFYGAFVSF